jgi:hypothetical protein
MRVAGRYNEMESSPMQARLFSLRLAGVHDGFLGNVIPTKCISALFMPPVTVFVRCFCPIFANAGPLMSFGALYQ